MVLIITVLGDSSVLRYRNIHSFPDPEVSYEKLFTYNIDNAIDYSTIAGMIRLFKLRIIHVYR